MDDLENEFNFDYENDKQNGQHIAEAMLHGQMSYGRGDDHDMPHMTHTMLPQVPLLTNGPSVSISFFSSSQICLDEACFYGYKLSYLLALLQNEDLSGISPEHHALVIPPFMGSGGKRVHPLPYIESSLPGILTVYASIHYVLSG